MPTKTATIKDGWQKLKLGEVLNLSYGKGLPERNRISGNFPVYGSGGIVGTHNESLIKAPGIIVGRKGSIGEVYYSGKDFYPIDTVYYIETKKDNYDLRFIYFLLKNLNLKTLNTDSAVPGLNRTVAHSQEISIPDISTQKKIAEILGAYDDLIEVNQKKIKILEDMAQTIYKEWLVKPVKNGLPDGWEEITLKQLVFLVKDKFIDEQDSKLPLVDMSRIQSNNLSITEIGKPEELSTSRIVFKKDDILFGSIRCYLHKVALAPFVGVTNTSVFVFRAKRENLKSLLTCFLFSKETLAWANQHSGGTKMPVINSEVLISKKIIIPKDSVIDNFHKVVWPSLKLIQSFSIQNQNLQKTRDLLIPQLVGGRVSLE